MMNPERIILEEFIDRHGLEDTLSTMREIMKEQIDSGKLTVQVESHARKFNGLTSPEVGDIIAAAIWIWGPETFYSGLLSTVELLKEESETGTSERRRIQGMEDALNLKSALKAWGLT